jgi:hypothetical protein
MADKIIAQYDIESAEFKAKIREIVGDYKKAEKAGTDSAKNVAKAYNAAGTSINRYGIESVKAGNSADKSIQRLVHSTRDLASNTNKVTERTAAGFNRISDSTRDVGSKVGGLKQQFSGLGAGISQIGAAMGVAFGVQQVISFGKASAAAFREMKRLKIG